MLSVDVPGAGPEVAAWAADHAAELGADPARIVVAGHAAGARAAVGVALGACADGWPPIARQVLVAPRLGVLHAALAGLPPATVIGGGDGPAYAARLRAAGVAVRAWDARDLRVAVAAGAAPG